MEILRDDDKRVRVNFVKVDQDDSLMILCACFRTIFLQRVILKKFETSVLI